MQTFCEEEKAELLSKNITGTAKNTTQRMTTSIRRISAKLSILLVYPDFVEKQANEDRGKHDQVSMFQLILNV